MHKCFLLLGTNLGDRLGYLRLAIEKIALEAGKIRQISPVFETEPWHFEAENNFLNCAVEISTAKSAIEILKSIKEIEQQLGRRQTSLPGYHSREIDIDILFFDDEIIYQDDLQIPHPRLAERSFALEPLCKIAPRMIHPVINKTISELLAECADNSKVEQKRSPYFNENHQMSLDIYNFISIEGNIGAGKTSLATRISEDFNAKLILEQFEENSFLPKFYKEPDKYAFPLELSFLAERFEQLKKDLTHRDLFKTFTISDYFISKSFIFARKNLPDDTFGLYKKLFEIISETLPKPDLLVYLYLDIDNLLRNIHNRGRDYELDIKSEYLIKIQESYLDFIKSQQNMRILIIDTNKMDFVHNEGDYKTIISILSEKYPVGVHRVTP
jgi:2-amino-4-hydroxy-6-hydroxymethyldihydropteridine diphosphokinase